MDHHIHVAGIFILSVIAVEVAFNFLVRTFGAHHPNAAMQGLVYSA